MKWWLMFYPSCLNCKYYQSVDQLTDGRCHLYRSFTERVRKDETKCGLKARNFTSASTSILGTI
jgi:hypothetical protein